MVEQDEVSRFMALFQGNGRSYGRWDPGAGRSNRMLTVKGQYLDEHVRSHLEGEIGLGLVPILDDDNCMFAVIDIDAHGPNQVNVDLVEIDKKIASANLPLVLCRSKSGGAHCYMFMKAPTPAARVRGMLTRWAAVLGVPQAEIFPKQITLAQKEGEIDRPLGNWINLPYYKIEETDRYAVDGSRQVTFQYFLELAESKRVDLDEFQNGSEEDYANGPPCLQEMVRNKVEEGARNMAGFQAAIFLKRAYPADWRMRFDDFNRQAMTSPLSQPELRKIAASVSKKDYQYKCREEPCRSLCNKDLCRTRQFGIQPGDMEANDIPVFDAVEQVIATPIRWVLRIKDKEVEVTTPQLFNYELIRQAVGEKLHIVLPRIKNAEWDIYLREIMSKVKVRHEMTVDDVVFQRLCEFLSRVRINKEAPEDERRQNLKRGAPTMIRINRATFKEGKVDLGESDWYYAFKMVDFVEFMRRKKALPMPDHQVPSALARLLGEEAKRDKMRVGSKEENARITNVWCVPEKSILEERVPNKGTIPEY